MMLVCKLMTRRICLIFNPVAGQGDPDTDLVELESDGRTIAIEETVSSEDRLSRLPGLRIKPKETY